MKKLLLAFIFVIISFCYAFASPHFKELNNHNGKTTVKIEFPSSDLTQTTVIRDWKLHNKGKVYDVKKVDVQGQKDLVFILEFKKLTKFSECSLSFTVNGKPMTIDLQSLMNR